MRIVYLIVRDVFELINSRAVVDQSHICSQNAVAFECDVEVGLDFSK